LQRRSVSAGKISATVTDRRDKKPMWIQLQSSWRPALEIQSSRAIYYLFRFCAERAGRWSLVIVVLLLALALSRRFSI